MKEITKHDMAAAAARYAGHGIGEVPGEFHAMSDYWLDLYLTKGTEALEKDFRARLYPPTGQKS